jgi:hypothetical protein
MIVTLCLQFDGASLGSVACRNIENKYFDTNSLQSYKNMYKAKDIEYYLDQPDCDDGWICTRAYVDFHYPGIDMDSAKGKRILDKVFDDDGENLVDITGANWGHIYDTQPDPVNAD